MAKAPPPIPDPLPREASGPDLTPAQLPDGSDRGSETDTSGLDPELVSRWNLDTRLFTMNGRRWLAVCQLAPEEATAVLHALDDPEVGVHIHQLGYFPGLGAWLRWEHLHSIQHLSFAGAFLKGKGLELVASTGVLQHLTTLDLAANDIGIKGLRVLNQLDAPGLRELHLHGNPDYDRTKWTRKAVDALIADTPKKPLGSALHGIEVLGLLCWGLVDSMDQLERSPLSQNLRELWIDDRYWDPPVQRYNVKALPPRLRAIAVVGWDRQRLS